MVGDETKWQRDKLPVIGNLFKKSMLRAHAKGAASLLRSFPWQQDRIGKIKPIYRDSQLQISSFGKLLYCCFPNGKAKVQGI